VLSQKLMHFAVRITPERSVNKNIVGSHDTSDSPAPKLK
jgi:hypothetical protein